MAHKFFVVRAADIQPFTLPEGGTVFDSQLIIGPDEAGSSDLHLHRFTLHAHQVNDTGAHAENDEAYYVLSGRGRLLLGGRVPDGAGAEAFDLEPGITAFIPAGTTHGMENDTDEDLVMLTIWPRKPAPGANPIHTGRIQAWGTSFRLRPGRDYVESHAVKDRSSI